MIGQRIKERVERLAHFLRIRPLKSRLCVLGCHGRSRNPSKWKSQSRTRLFLSRSSSAANPLGCGLFGLIRHLPEAGPSPGVVNLRRRSIIRSWRLQRRPRPITAGTWGPSGGCTYSPCTNQVSIRVRACTHRIRLPRPSRHPLPHCRWPLCLVARTINLTTRCVSPRSGSVTIPSVSV